MKRILLTVLALGLLGGVASADHRHGRGRFRGNASWSGGVSVQSAPVRVYQQPRRVYVERTRSMRRPIYVQRPPPPPGYYWVAGQWQWSGAEWVWYQGHYEPDPNYVDPSYSQPVYDSSYNYSSGYSQGYDQSCDHDGNYNGY